MKSPMHPMLKVVIAVTVVAIAVVVIQSRKGVAEQQAWGHYAEARAAGLTLESLETARDQVRGSTAEPWVDYQLALKYYDAGGAENFERARQVAQEAIDRHPKHATAETLRGLVTALESYAGPAGNG
jgi:hypothetical protein